MKQGNKFLKYVEVFYSKIDPSLTSFMDGPKLNKALIKENFLKVIEWLLIGSQKITSYAARIWLNLGTFCLNTKLTLTDIKSDWVGSITYVKNLILRGGVDFLNIFKLGILIIKEEFLVFGGAKCYWCRDLFINCT